MIRYVCGIVVVVVLFVDAESGLSQQQYLYSPTPVGAETAVAGKDGILVQDVSVHKGDSLYKISKKFSGRGSYYPQILLFNDIKNPNRIYPGNVFKVPVARHAVTGRVDKLSAEQEKATELRSDGTGTQRATGESASKLESVTSSAAPVAEIATQDLKKIAAGGSKKKRGGREKAAAKRTISAEKQRTVAGDAGKSSSGQLLFERAVKAYRQDDCRSALELFDAFLAEYQASPLAADASLYKAECYLKLSTQK